MELNDYRLLGRSGLRVSPLALGTMTFGTDWGWGADEAEARRIFDCYAEAGGNFVDTAVNYTNGSAERLLGGFLKGRRDRMVVGTKYTMSREPGDPNAGGNHRANLVRSVEASLRQLDTDRIDLLYLHAWDGTTSPEEVMRALDDLVRAGKVLYLGICNTPAWRVAQMQTLAELARWTPFVALQVEFNLIERTVEHELLPMARALGLGVLPWSPLANGLLAGKHAARPAGGSGTDSAATRSDVIAAFGHTDERAAAVSAAVSQVARDLGARPSQVALAWLLGRPGVVAPVIGARTRVQAEENLAALSLRLEAPHLRQLEEASALPPIFPASFVARPAVGELIFGGTRVAAREG